MSGAPSLAFSHHTDPPEGWDDFVEQCEPAHFEQTSWWANVESEDGWEAGYLAKRCAGRIVGGAMVLVRRHGRLGRMGYVVHGPLVCRDASDAADLRAPIAAELKLYGRSQNLSLMVIVPPYDGAEWESTLLDTGFLRKPLSLPPSYLPPGTITVDLRRPMTEIEHGYRRTLRQEINLARKKGVEVRLGTERDLESFWALHLDLCRRRGVASNVPGIAYARRAWHEFHRHGRAWLFNAILEEKVLCSLICLGVGKWFYAWRIGWASDSVKAYPTQAVYTQAIRTAAEAGYHFFDFMEIHPEEAARLVRGEAVDSPTAGVTFFKLGFGGDVRSLSPTLCWFPNNALNGFMRCIGLRLLSSGRFLKMASRLNLLGP